MEAILDGEASEAERILSETAGSEGAVHACFEGKSLGALAAEHGRLDILRMLLERGASVDGGECGNRTPILEAASQRNAEIVRFLLSRGAKADPADGNAPAPLVAAIVEPFSTVEREPAPGETIAVVRMLLEAGADPDRVNWMEIPPVTLAAGRADARMVRLLLAYGADPSKTDSKGKNAVDYAREHRLDYIASLLTGAKPPKADFPTPPLVEAAKSGNPAEVRKLLAEGADPNARDGGGSSALFHAASLGNDEIAALLLAGGADPNLRNQANDTALIHAAGGGHAGVVRLLLEKGADPRTIDFFGNGAAGYAVHQGHAEAVALLAVRKADLEETDEEGVTLLMSASGKGSIEVVRALLKGGARVNAADREGRTPLMFAAREGHEETVRLLAEAGADVRAKNREGNGALQEAVGAGHDRIAEYLSGRDALFDSRALRSALERNEPELVGKILASGVNPNPGPGEDPLLIVAAGAYRNKLALTRRMVEAGARVDDPDSEGKTALMEASRWSGEDAAGTVRYLLSKGADPRIRDRKGFTAWRFAAQGGHNAAARALEKAGAETEYESLAWDGDFLPGEGRQPIERVIGDAAAWKGLWQEMGRDGEAPAIDFGRYAAAFVFLGEISGFETRAAEFGEPGLRGDALVVPWSGVEAGFVYDVDRHSPWAVKVFDRRGAKEIRLENVPAIPGSGKE